MLEYTDSHEWASDCFAGAHGQLRSDCGFSSCRQLTLTKGMSPARSGPGPHGPLILPHSRRRKQPQKPLAAAVACLQQDTLLGRDLFTASPLMQNIQRRLKRFGGGRERHSVLFNVR